MIIYSHSPLVVIRNKRLRLCLHSFCVAMTKVLRLGVLYRRKVYWLAIGCQGCGPLPESYLTVRGSRCRKEKAHGEQGNSVSRKQVHPSQQLCQGD